MLSHYFKIHFYASSSSGGTIYKADIVTYNLSKIKWIGLSLENFCPFGRVGDELPVLKLLLHLAPLLLLNLLLLLDRRHVVVVVRVLAGENAGPVSVTFFCSTSLPIARTRWVRSKFYSHCPISSNQHG